MRVVCGHLPRSAAVLTLPLVLAGALALAQSDRRIFGPQPDAQMPPLPYNAQALPNHGPTDYAAGAPGFPVRTVEPRSARHPEWLAGQAVTTVVSPDHKTLLVLTSGYNRIFNTSATAAVPGRPSTRPSTCSSTTFRAPTPIKKQVVPIPIHLQRDCLRSIRCGFLRSRRCR